MALNERTTDRRTIGVIANSSGSSKIHIENVHVNSKEIDLDFDLPEPIQNFAERNEEFKQLESLFFNEDTTKIQNKVVICGIPGIGKSELAIQFADKCRNTGKFNNVYRIKAEQESELKKSWLQIKEIYKTSEKKKTLFILDNGISRKKLSECNFHMSDDFFFIITSQIKNWGKDIVPIKLSSLECGSAVEFYKKELEDVYTDKDRELLELANFVGCIPLGLQITAAGVRDYSKICGENCVREYLEELKTSEKNIIIEEFSSSSDNTYSKPLYTAIQMSLKKIEEESGPLKTSITLNVLYMSSYLDPEWGAYEGLARILATNKKYVNYKKIMLDKALDTLDNFSLVTFRNDEITMHRFTQEILRYHFRTCYPDEEKEFYEWCLENVVGNYGIGEFYVLEPILQHIDATIEPIVIHYFEKYGSKILVPEIGDTFLFILISLIKWGHTEIIKKIFDNSGHLAEVYITQYDLLKTANNYNQLDILELIQKNLDTKYSKNTNNNRTEIELVIEFYKYRLKEIYTDKNLALLEELANLVGCVEVGLEITAAGVRQYQNSYGENCFQEYLKDLKKSQINIIEFPFSFDNYDKLLYGAVKLALKKMEAGSDPFKFSFAFDVLYVCSWVHPTKRKHDKLQLLRNTMKYVNCDENMLDEALVTLQNFSLGKIRGIYFTIDVFIILIIRYHYRTYNPEKEKEFFETCLENVSTHYDTLYSDLLSSVLQHIDTTIETIVTNFLERHKSVIQDNRSIYTAFKLIFQSLVYWGHLEFIKKVFSTPGYSAEYYITEFDLLAKAKFFSHTDIEKLFQNYLNVNATDSKSTIINLNKRLRI